MNALTVLLGLYFAVFLAGMFSKSFREDLLNWLTLNDPVGLRFWANNWWFLLMTISIGVSALILILYRVD